MNDDLEERLVQERSCWLMRAFREERSIMGNHLVATVMTMGMTTSFSYYAPLFLHSDAAISGLATTLDIGGYWAILLPQLVYKDRRKLKDPEGKLSGKKVILKLSEFTGYIGIFEGIYAVGRFLGQYKLQKEGFDPATASAIIQSSGTIFLTLAFPPLRYVIRQWTEK